MCHSQLSKTTIEQILYIEQFLASCDNCNFYGRDSGIMRAHIFPHHWANDTRFNEFRIICRFRQQKERSCARKSARKTVIKLLLPN